MKKQLLSLFLIFSGIYHSIAQLPQIGHWREHVNYSEGIAVATNGDKVYHASRMGLFAYDIKDHEIELMSKINGLSDVGYSNLAYNKAANSLLIIYSNSNIDVLKNGKIYNMRDIRRSNIIGNKNIYGLTQQDEKVYLATGFGIVELDLKKLEVKGTYIFGTNGQAIKTNCVAITSDFIYAGTDEGLFKATLHGSNLTDYNYWTKTTNIPNPDMPVKSMAVIKDRLFIHPSGQPLQQDSLFYLEQGKLSYFEKGNNLAINAMEAIDDLLYVTHAYGVIAYDINGAQKLNIYEYNNGIPPEPRKVAFEKKGHYWIADKKQGLVSVVGSDFHIIAPNGPKTENIYKLSARQNQVWIASGGVTSSWASMSTYQPVSYFKDNQWHSFLPFMKETGGLHDILQIAVDQNNLNSPVYAATWGWGLGEMNESGMVKVHNWNNSPLEQNEEKTRTTISTAVYDKQGNLWVANTLAKTGLKVKKADGSWKSLHIPGVGPKSILGEMIITSDNNKWIILPMESAIAVFNDNGTIDDPSDDKTVILTAEKGKGELPGKNVLSIAEDLDGRVWVGTESGVGVFFSPSAVFSESNFDAQQILLTQDGNVQKLLENESVTAIAIDGSNRKWFGTDGGGVFLMSQDGTEQISAFNQDNSPLLSNSITSIAITQNGEVFIGTLAGLVSYRGTATTGNDKHREVYAFPNPVRPDYEGVIAINGLVRDADIKITDVNGNLVYETKAHGGQAIWDGYTLRGQKAATGVYFVFSSNNEGTEALVTKIMFAN